MMLRNTSCLLTSLTLTLLGWGQGKTVHTVGCSFLAPQNSILIAVDSSTHVQHIQIVLQTDTLSITSSKYCFPFLTIDQSERIEFMRFVEYDNCYYYNRPTLFTFPSFEYPPADSTKVQSELIAEAANYHRYAIAECQAQIALIDSVIKMQSLYLDTMNYRRGIFLDLVKFLHYNMPELNVQSKLTDSVITLDLYDYDPNDYWKDEEKDQPKCKQSFQLSATLHHSSTIETIYHLACSFKFGTS